MVHTVYMDAIDRQILNALRADGRVAWAELARQVGLSGPSIQERVKRLEEREIISGIHAEVNPEAVGLGVSAVVGVRVRDGFETDDVADRMRGVGCIEDCWYVAGEEEFLIRVRCRDVADLEREIGVIRRLPGIARTRTTIIMSAPWENRPAPLPATDHPLVH